MAESKSLLIKINGDIKDYQEKLKKVNEKTAALQKGLSKTLKGSTIAFAGLTTAAALSANQFSKYEKALVGVGKTTNISGKELDSLGKDFQKMSQRIPVATNELLGIAQAAGQLGVTGEQNLKKFTDTIAKLGVSTDLSGEQAATALTRILNVTGESIGTIDTFGSVIVSLGNQFAATESEITRMATEVSAATAIFDVSSAEAAALGTAMRSMGIRAELGGSTVGRAFRTIDASIRAGGKEMQNLIDLTGMTGDQLRKTFQEDSTQVFKAFIEGLGRIEEGNGDVTAELEKFGLRGQEVLKVLPAMAKNSELLGEALNVAAKETKNATALNEEAAKAFGTLDAEQTKTLNTLTNLVVKIGEELAPTIVSILQNVREFAKSLMEMDTEILSSIASFIKWGSIIAGGVAAISGFALAAIKVSGIIAALTAAFGPAALGASAFWAAVTGPIGIAVAGIAAVTAGAIALFNAMDDGAVEAGDTVEELNNQIEGLKRKKQEMANTSGLFGPDEEDLRKTQEQIDKLEKIRAEKMKASEDFGTGSMLMRPEPEQGPELGAEAFGFEGAQTIPLAPEVQEESLDKLKDVKKKEVETVKEAEKEKTDAKTEAQKERERREQQEIANSIAAIKAETATIQEIQKAKNQGLTDSDVEYMRRRAEIQAEFNQARLIEDKGLREATLANLEAKHAKELEMIERQEERKSQVIREREEERLAFQKEFDELSAEQRAMFNEQEREAMMEKIDTDREIEKELAEEKLERKIEEQNRFAREEKIHGTRIAKMKAFFRKSEVQGVKTANQELIQLTQSKNDSLRSIGKAAASVNAAIATSEGAIKAYTALAGIPIVGPGLGAAAAGALIAYGVERQSEILSANTGGFVPGNMGSPGVDSVSATLTPNEFVTPANTADEVINATAESRLAEREREEGDGEGGVVRVILEPVGDLVNFIQQQIVETRVQNTGLI